MSNTPLVIDEQAMKEKFIAIRYLHGSGGNFLNAWLTASKLNFCDITLGGYGSAHRSHKEFERYRSPIELPTISPGYSTITSPAPYFIHTEHISLPTISSIFYKVINISYDLDDGKDIAFCFLGKGFLENNKKVKYSLHYYHKHKYHSPVESTNNILNISWKEYLYGDEYELSEKLKVFTGIENISVEPLLEWREQTKLTINKTNTHAIINGDLITI